MATFSENQVRHLYVANELKSPNVAQTDNAGAIAVKSDDSKSHLYFQYKGADNVMRSDLIKIENILWAKATDADKMEHKLFRYKLTLDPSISSTPVAGQDYILKLQFRNYIGLSEEDQYMKFGMVHAVAGMTNSDFYKKMALSLVKNFSREEQGLLYFYLETGGTDASTVAGTPTLVDRNTKESDLTATYTGIVIEEQPQKWIRGVFEQRPVSVDILPDQVLSNGDMLIWGIVNKVDSAKSIPNGHKTADLEYFLMGERADMYRMVGFPNVLYTKYLVDPDKKYNYIDIHYCFQGSNEAVQKSEKTLTLVVPKVGGTNSVSNALANSIISAINTATGLTIEALGTEGE